MIAEFRLYRGVEVGFDVVEKLIQTVLDTGRMICGALGMEEHRIQAEPNGGNTSWRVNGLKQTINRIAVPL